MHILQGSGERDEEGIGDNSQGVCPTMNALQ